MRVASVIALLFALLSVSGCESLAYYRQGIVGQVRFYHAAEPINDVLRREDLDPGVRRRLASVPAIRDFAKNDLGLPVKGQYRDYVQLRAPAVAWNLFAAPELSLEPHRWCYFFHALCVEYRGYFRREDAGRYAARMRARGFDTDIGAVAAFSSLGLLDDPLTSVITSYPDDLMAMVLFHELAHAVLYVADDTAFNESFAEAVAAEGMRRWLRARGESAESPVIAAFRAQKSLVTGIALSTRAELKALYASNVPDDAKRARKREILAAASARYAERCRDVPSPGAPCPDADWFAAGLNNARLNSLAAYEKYVPAFAALLAAHDGDLPAFYRTVEEMGKMAPATRRRVLDALQPADTGIAK